MFKVEFATIVKRPGRFWRLSRNWSTIDLYNLYIFGKIFSSSTRWCKENVRNRKFVADNSGLKNFCFFFYFKPELSATNFRFLTFSLHHLVELEKIFPKMYRLYRSIVDQFRDKRQKRPGRFTIVANSTLNISL